MLNATSARLLSDVWELPPEELFAGAHVLVERVVQWGADRSAASVAGVSVAVAGDTLAARLLAVLRNAHGSRLQIDPAPADVATGRDWIVDAGGRRSTIASTLGGARRVALGRRHAICATAVLLAPPAGRRASYIESVGDGWVFLAPTSPHAALVQAMVPAAPEDASGTLTDMLSRTRLIRGRVGLSPEPPVVLAAAPSRSEPVCGGGWIAVGDAALAFDPIAGDGTGAAVRSSILAAAVLDGIEAGLRMRDCLDHYEQRLREAFAAHVTECLDLYGRALWAPTWREELELMWSASREQPDEPTDYAFRLDGLRLAGRSSASG